MPVEPQWLMPCCCCKPQGWVSLLKAGWGSGQPDLVDGIPAHCEGWELGDLKGPFQTKPFCGLGETVKAHSSHLVHTCINIP